MLVTTAPTLAAPANGGVFGDALYYQTRLLWPHEQKVLLPLIRDTVSGPCRLLDVCCGTGQFLDQIAQVLPGAQLGGVDHSAEGVWQAKQLLQNRAQLRESDATNLPWEDGYWDVVVCRHALQTMPAPVREGVVREMVRVCRPGGLIYVTNEDNGVCWGSVAPDRIEAGMRVLCRIWDRLGMDIRLARTQDQLLRAFGLTPQVAPMIVSAREDVDAWEQMVRYWTDAFLDMAESADMREVDIHTLGEGLALYQHCGRAGHAEWPVWACWARKPYAGG